MNVPEPETVCKAEPFNVKFAPVVVPTEKSIIPLFNIFPETINVLPVVPLKTFTEPPKLTNKLPFIVNEVGVVP